MRKHALLLALAICPAFTHAQDATPTPTPDPATYVPEIARVEAARGNAAFSKGDYKAARAAYERVLDLAPNNLVALVNLGLVEFRAGERDIVGANCNRMPGAFEEHCDLIVDS